MALTRLGVNNISNSTIANITALPAAIATGKVLQVVETRKTDTASTTSSSYSAISGLSASITPASSSYKILIIYNVAISSGNHAHTVISRDSGSSFIGSGVASGSRPAANTYHYEDSNSNRLGTVTVLDSPSSTSALTYQVYWRTNASTAYINRTQNDTDAGYGARSASSVTLMEIAG